MTEVNGGITSVWISLAMPYEIGDLPLQPLLPATAPAEDQLARLDEIVRRSPVAWGFIERGYFFDAVACMWLAGELVHIEDLVLHDARMDIRAPTHELTIAHAILRSHRCIASADLGWALSEAGVASLAGPAVVKPEDDPVFEGDGYIDPEGQDDDPLSRELARINAIINRSRRVLDAVASGPMSGPSEPSSLVVGGQIIRDPDWDERELMVQWRAVLKRTESLLPMLSAAILFDAWETIEPLQQQHPLGGQLIAAYLRARGKVTWHLPGFHVGLKAIPGDRRRAGENDTIARVP